MFFKKPKSSGLTAEIRIKRCYGCGSILQSEDPNESGYVPKEKFDSEEDTLCERCYKLRHYSQYKESKDINIDYMTILNAAKKDNALIVYVFNAFSLYGSLIEGIGDYISDKTLVVINKRDLLPKNYDDEYLKNKVKTLLKTENINPLDVIITSASPTKTNNIDNLLNAIDKYREKKDVYFIGSYQVGKSSLINSLLMAYTNNTNRIITTSPYPGTTLDVISIPLDNKTNIYDTPGINNLSSIISHIEGKIIKYVLPRNEIRPESYTAKEGQTFLFSNLARFDFIKGDKTTFTFFKSNDLTLERCKLNKADETLVLISNNSSLETRTEKVTSMKSLAKVSFKCEKGKQCKIRIHGLGFIDFMGNDQEIDVYVIDGVKVTLDDTVVKL